MRGMDRTDGSTSCAVLRRVARQHREEGLVRIVRNLRNKKGERSMAVAIPPAVYVALGEPRAIWWTIDEGVASMEVVE